MSRKLASVLFSILLVCSMVAPFVAFSTQSVAAATTTDTFEDQSTSGWSGDSGTTNTSYQDTYSMVLTDNNAATWDDGPSFSNGDTLQVSGRYQMQSVNDYGIEIRLEDSDGDNVRLSTGPDFSDFKGISTSGDNGALSNWDAAGTSIGSDFGNWANFKIQIENGYAYAKRWKAGNAEPKSWEVVTPVADGIDSAKLKIEANTDLNREAYVDEVSYDTSPGSIQHQVTDDVDTSSWDSAEGDLIPVANVSGEYVISTRDPILYKNASSEMSTNDTMTMTGQINVKYPGSEFRDRQAFGFAKPGGGDYLGGQSLRLNAMDRGERIAGTAIRGETSTGQTIDSYYSERPMPTDASNQWTNFEIHLEDSFVYTKMWAVGNAEPSDYQNVVQAKGGISGVPFVKPTSEGEVDEQRPIRLRNFNVNTNASPLERTVQDDVDVDSWNISGSPALDTIPVASLPKQSPSGKKYAVGIGPDGNEIQKEDISIDTSNDFTLNGTMFSTDAYGGGTEYLHYSSWGLRNTTSNKYAELYWGDPDASYRRQVFLETNLGSTPNDGKQTITGEWVNYEFNSTGGNLSYKYWNSQNTEPAQYGGTTQVDDFTGDFTIRTDSGYEEDVYWTYFGTGVSSAGGSNLLSGTVEDQNGNPVKNASVVLTGVNNKNINSTTGDLNETAQNLLQEAQNPTPKNWTESESFTGPDGLLSDVNGKYVVAHTPSDWGFTAGLDDPQLGTPRGTVKKLPANQKVILSMWDARDGGLIQDGVDSDLPGSTEDGKIVAQQIGPAGSVLNEQTYTQSGTYDVFTGGEHDYATVSLSPGFYRLHPKGSPANSIVVAAGDPESITAAYADDLRDRAGQLTERAKQVRDQFQQNILTRQTVTTNENGEWNASIPSSTTRVAAQAYKTDGTLVTSGTYNASTQGIRDAFESGYNGTIYITREPTISKVPNQNVTVKIQTYESPPFADLNRTKKYLDWVENWLNNADWRPDVTNVTEKSVQKLRDLREKYVGMVNENERAKQYFCEVYPDYCINGEINFPDTEDPKQLQIQVEALIYALENTPNDIGIEDPDWTWEDNPTTLTEEITLPTSVGDISALNVTAIYEDGTTEQISGDTLVLTDDGQTLRVDGYEVPEDKTFKTLDVAYDDNRDPGKQLPINQTQYLSTTMELGGFGNSADAEDLTVLTRFQDGSTRNLSTDYWRVDNRIGQSDRLVIEDWPVPENQSVVTVEVFANTEDGFGRITDPVKNPLFDGELLDLRAMSVSTLSPGPDDTVTVRPDPETKDATLTKATVRGPDGPMDTTRTGDTVQFQTNSTGRYEVSLGFNASNETFTRQVSIQAYPQPRSGPPAVHETGDGDTFALVTQLRTGSVETSVGEKTMTAVVGEDSDPPRQVSFNPSPLQNADTTVETKVLRGEDKQSLRKRVQVRVNLGPMPEDALVYRVVDGEQEPIPVGESSQGIRRHNANQTVVETTTEADGTVAVRVDRDPWIGQRVLYDFNARFDVPDIPDLDVVSPLSVAVGA